MSYTSFTFFIIYFGITYLFYSIIPQKFKWCVLLAGSFAFYTVAVKGHILFLVLSSVIIWAIGLALQKLNDDFKAKKKGLAIPERKVLKNKYKNYKMAVLMLGVLINLGILFASKYSGFFAHSVNAVFNTNLHKLNIIQPMGISFYTLQAVSYITDIYRGRFEACKNPFKTALYLSFMLTVVEGPVARFDQLGTQLIEGKKFDYDMFVRGVWRVFWGIFKKVVIADRAAILVNTVYNNPEDHGGTMMVIATLFYTLQLYGEFSGVMDVVCGLGEMMGIEMPENFNRPFFAKSINEFWQRWHISLGSWLRDYIFYPISLSKPFMSLTKSARKKFNPYYANLIPTAVALFFVWFANGFWHGSGLRYIVYGLYYYALMMLGLFFEPLSDKFCKAVKINRKSKAFGVFQMLRTFVIVNFGMLIFRADSLRRVLYMTKKIILHQDFSVLKIGAANGVGLDIKDYIIILVGTLVIFAVGVINEKNISIRDKILGFKFPVRFILLLLFILLIIFIGAYGTNYGVQDLIYANF